MVCVERDVPFSASLGCAAIQFQQESPIPWRNGWSLLTPIAPVLAATPAGVTGSGSAAVTALSGSPVSEGLVDGGGALRMQPARG